MVLAIRPIFPLRGGLFYLCCCYIIGQDRYHPKKDWYAKDDKPSKPFIHYNAGGNSKMYRAALFRFRESDFEEMKHHGGISSAWPLKYDVYENYYEQAEELYSVHGKRGVDPSEPLQA